ncbi:hypothetical protein G6F63_015673 [Rhizopus arrhizus]|nr:hypothetical protein G6F63_015673 [Rhizopus arrhizus]
MAISDRCLRLRGQSAGRTPAGVRTECRRHQLRFRPHRRPAAADHRQRAEADQRSEGRLHPAGQRQAADRRHLRPDRLQHLQPLQRRHHRVRLAGREPHPWLVLRQGRQPQ